MPNATLAVQLSDTSIEALYRLKTAIEADPAVESAAILEVTAPESFREALTRLLNQYGKDAAAQTPDYILAEHLESCIKVLQQTTAQRDAHTSPSVVRRVG
jgi:hypothetical protein